MESVENVFPITGLRLQQSDTWNIVVDLPRYPPQAFVLTYVLVPSAGGNPTSANSVPWAEDPARHQILVPGTTTTGLPPGRYQAQAYVTETATGYRTTLCDTVLQILPDLSLDQPAVDARTANEKMLDAINAALAADLTSAVVEYTIAGRSFKKNRWELIRMRQVYEFEVRREKGLAMGNAIYFSM
jgi:hypothetical protein